MLLSRENLSQISASVPVQLPDPSVFELPERILQFGTGVLLRGLCDYFVDKANRQGVFNGRIVVVKSTGTDTSEFDQQDQLFTQAIRGLDENGQPIEEYIVNASISRTLAAPSQWDAIIACASNSDMQIVISNTTEIGIQLDENENLQASPPQSFPGKLTAFLYARWKAFEGAADKGMVIVPTELVPDNGTNLRKIVLELAKRGQLEAEFIQWLGTANSFCNSLVDRIVPGKPNATDQADYEQKLGYQDHLLCVSEVYRLWAIEGDEKVKSVLSFDEADCDETNALGVIIKPDIDRYRELKLRLLNGSHSLTCGLNFLAGKNAVRESMADPVSARYVKELMFEELAPAIPYDIDLETARTYGASLLNRFANPFLEHKLLSITLYYTSKMKTRNVPLLLKHYQQVGTAPERFALGFAAYVLFMKALKEENGKYFGERNGDSYLIQDEPAGWYFEWWNRKGDLSEVLSNQDFWGTDLNALPGFNERVSYYIGKLQESPKAAFEEALA
ncbi:tagaturonate reductase [Siphonobacter sp. SORGH_AS_0500]|uniref:tagaturonate reductase n=1 Tax=Siphonobacter sp. SORGH_AS_0500 TaxID=1864824 RepID=UPI00285AD4E5|nr:tagaturonate reductase [Siphonobacter sp. SORGH_AS_0500]MDR6193735.1 tagaturonate reductase [Siphonobacter sp. SORGH_AS_0500]